MKTYIPKILAKPHDYWICPNCKGLNWYENEICTGENKGGECNGLKPPLKNSSKKRKREEMKIIEFAQKELSFYMGNYGYSEKDCDHIEIHI